MPRKPEAAPTQPSLDGWTKKRAFVSIAIELHNQNRLRLAEIELQRSANKHLEAIATACREIADGLAQGQAVVRSTQDGASDVMPLLRELIQRTLVKPSGTKSISQPPEPAAAPLVEKQTNGVRVQGRPE